jgi:hypothetical protein
VCLRVEPALVEGMITVATLVGLALFLGSELMQRLGAFMESVDRLRNRNRDHQDGDDE